MQRRVALWILGTSLAEICQILQDLTVYDCLVSDEALRGFALSLSPYPSLPKLRLGVTELSNAHASTTMAFTSLQTVLRKSPSHLILDLKKLAGPKLGSCRGGSEPRECLADLGIGVAR